jgi:hypothetical protein
MYSFKEKFLVKKCSFIASPLPPKFFLRKNDKKWGDSEIAMLSKLILTFLV